MQQKTELFKYKFYNFRHSFSPMDYADASMENLYRFFYFTNTSCILVDNLNISVCLTVCPCIVWPKAVLFVP